MKVRLLNKHTGQTISYEAKFAKEVVSRQGDTWMYYAEAERLFESGELVAVEEKTEAVKEPVKVEPVKIEAAKEPVDVKVETVKSKVAETETVEPVKKTRKPRKPRTKKVVKEDK